MKLQALCSLLLLEASAAPQGPQLRSGRDSLSLAVWPELPARPPLPEQAAGLLIKDKAFAGWGCSNDSLGMAWPEAFSASAFHDRERAETGLCASPYSGVRLPPRG